MKKLLALALVMVFVVTTFAACGGPEMDAKETCEVLYNLYIKQDTTNTDKLSISASEAQEVVDIMNTTAKETFISNATSGNDLVITDEQAAAVCEAIYNAQKKLTPTFEMVSSDKKTATVKITTNYIDQTTIDTDAAMAAVEEVNAMNLTSETEWNTKVIERYVALLVEGLNNAEPSSETREMTVEMEITDGIWMPSNMQTFATQLSSSISK